MNIPSDSENWRSIQNAPKDGRLVLVKGKSGEWVASWRGPRRGEPQYLVHTQKEWRDLSGRWATPDYWKPIKQELAPSQGVLAIRQARSREARAKAGGKQIAVMLTPAAAAKLAEHIAKGESITAVVNRLMCDSKPH